MIRTLAFLVTLLIADAASANTSGVVSLQFKFFNDQIGYTTTPGASDWYKEAQFRTQQPVRQAFVQLIDPNTGYTMSYGWTDVNGWTQLWWFSPTNSTSGFFRVYWQGGDAATTRFKVMPQAGGQWYTDWSAVSLTPNTTTNSPQTWGGPFTYGSSTFPVPHANIYDGAWRMWYYALSYSAALASTFVNVPIRYPSSACPTSCADNNGVDLDTGASTPYATPWRISHELGHVAQYLTAVGNNAGHCAKYGYPGIGTTGGWNQNSAEWGCISYIEGFASFLSTVSRHWFDSTRARECAGSEVGACSLNIETSSGFGCPTSERRSALTTQRFLWDAYDSINDGESNSEPYWRMLENHAMFQPGTFDGERDEWNDGTPNLSGGQPIDFGYAGFDGRSVGDWWWNYFDNYSVALADSYHLNCQVPYD